MTILEPQNSLIDQFYEAKKLVDFKALKLWNVRSGSSSSSSSFSAVLIFGEMCSTTYAQQDCWLENFRFSFLHRCCHTLQKLFSSSSFFSFWFQDWHFLCHHFHRQLLTSCLENPDAKQGRSLIAPIYSGQPQWLAQKVFCYSAQNSRICNYKSQLIFFYAPFMIP